VTVTLPTPAAVTVTLPTHPIIDVAWPRVRVAHGHRQVRPSVVRVPARPQVVPVRVRLRGVEQMMRRVRLGERRAA
jgi:hypothetical protein